MCKGWIKDTRSNSYKTNFLYEDGSSDSRFPSYGYLNIKENIHEFPCRHGRRETSGTLLCSTTSDWGPFAATCYELLSTAVARCGSADWVSYAVHKQWGSSTFYSVVWESFYSILPKQWMGWCGLTAWPVIYPDFSLLYFYIWGNLKPVNFAALISDHQNL